MLSGPLIQKKKGLVSVVLVPGHTSIPREAYGKIKMKQQSWAWRVATHPEVQIPLVGVGGWGPQSAFSRSSPGAATVGKRPPEVASKAFSASMGEGPPRKGASHVALVVKNPPANAGDIEMQVRSLGQEDPLEEGRAAHSSILAGESHGRRSLVVYSPRGRRVGHD